ncbi:diaminopimelate decarboxylase [Natrononativus amylolyticus]|uniref:diaminopimelate decarboxylase n=1 Tax=Natrononativus amylolyticus TaxID=2963434 RepID=UPI0020CF326C|nr:diaminopimelate decarboxylase [Natrononativus amylolyticus]
MHLEARRARLLERESALRSPFETPVYVFWEDDIRENYRRLRGALDDHYPDSAIHFAVKANYNPGILSVLRDEGCRAEVYAGGELTAALEAGFDPSELLVTGMNRRPADVERALECGVERFLVDNATELERLIEIATDLERRPQVLIRGNPSMEVPTHPEVATATHETKFGLDIDSGRAMTVAERAVDSAAVDLTGVQLHIGSQIKSAEPYGVAARAMCGFAAEIRDELGVEIDVLDLGGGFPVSYDEDVPAAETIVERIADTVAEATAEAGLPAPTLYLEPGRRLVGNAGTLLATVGVVKETPYRTFAVLDAGTNAVSSYWPYPIYALAEGEPTERYHVAGPLCYSGDVIAEDVPLPPLERDDVIAVDRIGAYSLGSASNTNAQPKPPVLLARSNGDVDVIREPERYEDVISHAAVPADLADAAPVPSATDAEGGR